MKRISILGSTGSIGRQSLAVVDAHPGKFEVVALSAGANVQLAAEQAVRHRPQVVSVSTADGAKELCDRLKQHGKKSGRPQQTEVLYGAEGIVRVATHPDAQMVISAAVG